uniref:RING-type domain-containing protein n=1 Tax=Davidia involucrata TaxID=16924 RepID=A0A5B7A3S4_DAVIN
MAIPFLGLLCKSQTDKFPLLMERPETHNDSQHIIDITSSSGASSSSSSHDRPLSIISSSGASSSSSSHDRPFNGLDPPQREDQPSASVRIPVFQPSLSSASISNSRNSSLIRRGDGHGRRRRSPLNSGLWISFELFLTVSQIIASIVVLSLSSHERPHAPLFAWIVGYVSGCVATLPLLYWRYRHRNQASEQDSSQPHQGSPESNLAVGPTSYSLSNARPSEGEAHRTIGTTSRGGQSVGILSSRLKVLVEYFKMALDCFFAVWFVVGNVWIFGGHSSSSDAPNLYTLCIVFLSFSCIGYAMPFILCATICCCFPCIVSVLGVREDLTQNRGATPESINSLPTFKFKIKKNRNGNDRENNTSAGESGVVAAGTEKERVISGEDAACCICLAKYANNDELRELPCSHFFHKECVDKWLKINALCPLCKAKVGESILGSLSGAAASLQRL